MLISSAVDLVESEGSQHINQWKRPHFWFVVYADDDTCGDAAPSENHVIEYELTFLNPDSGGDATDHFGEDQRGVVMMSYCCSVLCGVVVGPLAQSVERRADNAKAVSSRLTWTTFFFLF